MDLRDAYFSALYKRCQEDESVIVLAGDFSATWLDRISKDFKRQYFNVGIAEQNMISVAAGLALEGRKVFVCGQNNFITLRAMEQISVDLCQMRLSVTLVGVGSGFAFSIDGPTHHGVTDLGMMMQLPVDIYNVGRNSVVICAMQESQRPKYVRLGKGDYPPIYFKEGSGFDSLGVVPGNDVIITSGVLVHEMQKVGTSLIDLYRPSGFDSRELVDVLQASNHLIVVEDNLEAPIAKALAGAGIEVDLSICPKGYLFEYGSEDFMLRKAGIDADSVKAAICAK